MSLMNRLPDMGVALCGQAHESAKKLKEVTSLDQVRSKELQEKLAKEALVVQEMGGSRANTANYEQAVHLIGKACGIPSSDTEARLAAIRQNRDDLHRIEAGETVAKRVFPDEDRLMANWTGLETLDAITDLFEASLGLEQYSERHALFSMAMELMDTQCLLDWIEKSTAEKEADAV